MYIYISRIYIYICMYVCMYVYINICVCHISTYSNITLTIYIYILYIYIHMYIYHIWYYYPYIYMHTWFLHPKTKWLCLYSLNLSKNKAIVCSYPIPWGPFLYPFGCVLIWRYSIMDNPLKMDDFGLLPASKGVSIKPTHPFWSNIAVEKHNRNHIILYSYPLVN